MDIMLKGQMDGIVATQIINEHFNIPVIYLSGNSDNTIIKRVSETKHYGFLLKPFKKNDLHDAILNVLSEMKSQD